MSEQAWQDCFTLQADNSHLKLPLNLNLSIKLSHFSHVFYHQRIMTYMLYVFQQETCIYLKMLI